MTSFLRLTQISLICGGFVFSWAHTDLTDLTDFFVGGKSHGLCGGVFGEMIYKLSL